MANGQVPSARALATLDEEELYGVLGEFSSGLEMAPPPRDAARVQINSTDDFLGTFPSSKSDKLLFWTLISVGDKPIWALADSRS